VFCKSLLASIPMGYMDNEAPPRSASDRVAAKPAVCICESEVDGLTIGCVLRGLMLESLTLVVMVLASPA
jgi:hypothetical protein